jgi:hypothetical protein
VNGQFHAQVAFPPRERVLVNHWVQGTSSLTANLKRWRTDTFLPLPGIGPAASTHFTVHRINGYSILQPGKHSSGCNMAERTMDINFFLLDYTVKITEIILTG